MAKKYKCPYCQDKLIRKELIDHIDNDHEELIPDGFESAQVVYDLVNNTKGAGKCRVCNKPTKWNTSAKRYDVLCENPRCKQKMREEYQKNMLRVHGTYNILNNDEQQKKMLANRKISGTYKFTDGGVVTYTGSYEKKFLEFADKVMMIPSKDIMAPGPTIEYEMNGEKHFYITDFLYIPYNLIIEVKDGGNNPNNKNSEGMKSSRQRTIEKEKLITDRGEYNYLRLTDNQFVQLIEIFMEIKKALIEGNDNKVVRINEFYINGNLETKLVHPFLPKRVNIYHGTISKDYDIINPTSYNMGTKFSSPRLSSFWFIEIKYAKAFAVLEIIGTNLKKKEKLYIDKDMNAAIPERCKDEVIDILKKHDIYVYEKQNMESKYLGVGHGKGFPEYTVDFPVKPDNIYTVNYPETLQYVNFRSDEYFEELRNYYHRKYHSLVYYNYKDFKNKNKEIRGYAKESYINESKSTIDNNYKPKGKKNLSSFKRVHITESVINKYKKEYPFLKHVRCKDTEEYICDGYIWFDDDELVAMVGSCEYTDDKTKWVVSLKITKNYKGYGLSKQILDYAVKTMNCKYLSVNKNNEIAKKVYDNYGFKVYQEDNTMYYMTIDKNVKESYINENLILNNKDLEINLDKFESGEKNVLLITGFSGSGKSTIAKSLASKYKCDNYELDCLDFYCGGLLIRENLIGNEDGLVAFIDSRKLEPNKNISTKEMVALYRDYLKFLINWCKKQKDKKFIIEGLQIYEIYQDGDTFITSCPIIIKGTSGLVSAIRAAKRNDGSFVKEFGPLIKWALNDNKALNKLKKDLNESYIYADNILQEKSYSVFNGGITHIEKEDISYSTSFDDVKEVVNSLSKEDLNKICNGEFKNSPYVIYREVLLINKEPVSFIDVYKLPNMKEDGIIVIATKEKWRGVGLSSRLIKRMKTKLKNKNLVWKTQKNNYSSIYLAKKMKFEPIFESYINESSSNKTLYHLSQDNLNGKILSPRVPSNFLIKNGYEDGETKRVCFAKSIDGSLRGMSQNLKGMKLYVHVPDGNHNIYNPTVEEVPDCKITGEVWIKEPVKLKCIGLIEVIDDKGEDGIPYKYGNNTAELYDWEWKWLEKTNESYISEALIDNRADLDSQYLENGDHCFNLNLWNSNDNNILYITGLSGSGKTTLGIDIAKNYNAYRAELDYVIAYYMKRTVENNKQSKFINYLKTDCPIAVQFLKTHYYEPYDGWGDGIHVIKDFLDWFVPRVYGDGNLYVINGAQIPKVLEPEFFVNKPIIIKEGNLFKSLNRRTVREEDYSLTKKIKYYIKFLLKASYHKAHIDMKVYAKDVSKYAITTETYISEARKIDNKSEIEDVINVLTYSPKRKSSISYDDLTKFTAYHLEPVIDAKNKKDPYYAWDEDLYSKSIEAAIVNDIKDNYKCKRYNRVSAYVYAAGKDLKPIYLGTITIFDKNNPNDWEWEEQEILDKKTYDYLIKHPIVEITDISNFYEDDCYNN